MLLRAHTHTHAVVQQRTRCVCCRMGISMHCTIGSAYIHHMNLHTSFHRAGTLFVSVVCFKSNCVAMPTLALFLLLARSLAHTHAQTHTQTRALSLLFCLTGFQCRAVYTNQKKACSKFLTIPITVNRLVPRPLSRHLSCSMIDNDPQERRQRGYPVIVFMPLHSSQG